MLPLANVGCISLIRPHLVAYVDLVLRTYIDYKIREFKKQIAAGVSFAVGSDVGPFPHGTQARELTPMVQNLVSFSFFAVLQSLK